MRRKTVFTSLLVLALCAGAGFASTFVAMDPLELAAGSSAVIEGDVVEVHSFWDESGRIIVTEATVVVERLLGGSAPAEVRVRTFGGEVAGYRVEAHGFPRFEVGERVLLYLDAAGAGPARVTGYQLGQYRIQEDAAGRELAVPALEPGVVLLRPDGRPAPMPRTVPLATLEREIRAAWQARGLVQR